jgi:hypothetical protein
MLIRSSSRTCFGICQYTWSLIYYSPRKVTNCPSISEYQSAAKSTISGLFQDLLAHSDFFTIYLLPKVVLHPPSAFDTPNRIIAEFKVFSGLLRQRLRWRMFAKAALPEQRSVSKGEFFAMRCRNKFGMTLRVW